MPYHFASWSELERVAIATAEVFGVAVEDLRRNLRTREYSTPRHVAMYLMCVDYQATRSQVARYLERDPSTVTHAIQKVRERRAFAPHLKLVREHLEAGRQPCTR